MDNVLLLNMPFISLSRPAIGISLLKARLNEEGLACDTDPIGEFLLGHIIMFLTQLPDAIGDRARHLTARAGTAQPY